MVRPPREKPQRPPSIDSSSDFPPPSSPAKKKSTPKTPSKATSSKANTPTAPKVTSPKAKATSKSDKIVPLKKKAKGVPDLRAIPKTTRNVIEKKKKPVIQKRVEEWLGERGKFKSPGFNDSPKTTCKSCHQVGCIKGSLCTSTPWLSHPKALENAKKKEDVKRRLDVRDYFHCAFCAQIIEDGIPLTNAYAYEAKNNVCVCLGARKLRAAFWAREILRQVHRNKTTVVAEVEKNPFQEVLPGLEDEVEKMNIPVPE